MGHGPSSFVLGPDGDEVYVKGAVVAETISAQDQATFAETQPPVVSYNDLVRTLPSAWVGKNG